MQRDVLNKLALRFGVKDPRDWGKIRTCDVIANGGRKIIKEHNGSLFKSLQHTFPEEWMQFMPRNYWISKENQREYLERFASKFGIKKPKDWAKITWKQVLNEKGGGLLNVYNNSLYRALSSVYSDIKWKREWFPSLSRYERNFWNFPSNQIIFMDTIASQYNIQKPSDWKRITASMIRNLGGQPLLSKYGHNVFGILMNVYPQQISFFPQHNTGQINYKLISSISNKIAL